jgi:hypothetical protein
MTPEDRRELEGLVEELRALVPRLRRHGQPLATQLLEMAVLEIKSRMYGINDEEFQALVDTLSGHHAAGWLNDSAEEPDLVDIEDQAEGLIRTKPPVSTVVALSEINRSKRKRRN